MAGMEGGGRREGGREGGCGRGRYHLGRGCGDQSEEIGHVLHVTVVNMIPLLPQPRMISLTFFFGQRGSVGVYGENSKILLV